MSSAIAAVRGPIRAASNDRSCTSVVDFYDQRFNIGFTKQEKSDLVAFLRSL